MQGGVFLRPFNVYYSTYVLLVHEFADFFVAG